jgi:hypothetical protein
MNTTNVFFRKDCRRQRHFIEARLEEAKEDYVQKREQIKGSNDFVPKPRKLLRVTTSVERSVDKVLPPRESGRRPRHPSSLAPSTRPSKSPESPRPTDSTTASSFVSKPSSFSEPAASVSPATSAEELEKISNDCVKCTYGCACCATEPSLVILSRPPSLASPPPPRPSTFEHPSHRFDRSWWQPGTKDTVYQPTNGTCPASEDGLCASRQVLKELTKRDPGLERIIIESEELLAHVEASRRKSMIPEYSEEPNEEEHESDDGEEVEGISEKEDQLSPFQPVAGVQGKFPPGWRKRHERSESPDDHWHKKL